MTLSREKDGDTFLGAVVNLGALGVVTKVTLDIQPAFLMRQDVYVDLPLAQLADHFESIMSSGYSVSLFTDWQNKRINEVWVKRRVEKGDARRPGPSSIGARLATKNLHPIAELSAENCTEQMGVPGPWYRAVAPLPHGVHPEQRQGVAVRVLRPPQGRGRGHPRDRATAGPGEPPPADLGTAHGRRRTGCG